MGTTLINIIIHVNRLFSRLSRSCSRLLGRLLPRRAPLLLGASSSGKRERLHQNEEVRIACERLDAFLALQLQHFPSTREGGETPQFHSKRDCITYLFFVFGAISRLERTISDEALSREWRNWRKSRICRGYYPKRATASFIKRYPKMLNSKLQNAFASGCYAMDMQVRCATGQISPRECQKADRELRRVLITNHEHEDMMA